MPRTLQPLARCLPGLLALLLATLSLGCATQAEIDAWVKLHSSSNPKTPEQAPQAVPERSNIRDFDTLIEAPSEDFDLTLALLLFAHEYADASLQDVEYWLELVDQWSANLRTRIAAMTRIEQRVHALRDMVHHELGFRFDPGDPKGTSPDNLFLHRVLRRRRGYCVSLSMIYLMLARGANIPLYGIRLPGHFAIAYMDQGRQHVLESTSQGRPRSRTELYATYRMSVASEEHGVFLAKLNDREIFSTFFNNLGGISVLDDQAPHAREHYRKGIELDPANVEPRYNLARILTRSGSQDELQDALALLNEAIRLDPNFYYAFCGRAALYHRANQPEEARRDIRKAKLMRPELATAYTDEGVMLYREGLLDEAKIAFESALEKEGDNPDALRNLSVIEDELGNHQRAQELATRYEALRE